MASVYRGSNDRAPAPRAYSELLKLMFAVDTGKVAGDAYALHRSADLMANSIRLSVGRGHSLSKSYYPAMSTCRLVDRRKYELQLDDGLGVYLGKTFPTRPVV
jgi:hypothetical protein